MPQIAVINLSGADDTEVAYAAKAVDAQLREDFCPRWPTVPYQPVTFFRTTKGLPTAKGISLVFSIVDSFDGEDGQSAYHSWAGVPFVKICRQLGELSVMLSHEALEETVNPTCLKTFRLLDGATAAYEVADPVQGWTYTKPVSLLKGPARDVNVSAFALPSYFEGNGQEPCTYAPGFAVEAVRPGGIAPGGYLPILGPMGWEPRFGMATDPGQVSAKAVNPTGRASRRAWNTPRPRRAP